MSQYSRMAQYYDTIYSKIVDYPSQTDYLEKIFTKHHEGRVRSILDVACGTGNYTFEFAKRRYDVTGIDSSDDMINIALQKQKEIKMNPEFVKMDMRDIELKNKFDIAAVLFGGFGYLLEADDVMRFFSSVRDTLRPNALLIFEFWHNAAILPAAATSSGLKNFDTVRNGNRLIIRLHLSKFEAETNKLAILFDLYVIDTLRKKLLDSFSEKHVVKTYAISEVARLVEASNFKPLAFYAGGVGKMTKLELAEQSTFRVLAVAGI
ncbi:MAG: class I SAM-dependent DNA methyltransferase [Nitrososphaerales archaeon]